MTVERMCQLGGISRSGFYRIESRSEGVDRDVELRDAIQRPWSFPVMVGLESRRS